MSASRPHLGGFFSLMEMKINPETRNAVANYTANVIESKTYDYEGNPVSFFYAR